MTEHEQNAIVRLCSAVLNLERSVSAQTKALLTMAERIKDLAVRIETSSFGDK